VITLISVGIVESMLATLEVQRSSKRFGDGSTQKERSGRFLYLANVHANRINIGINLVSPSNSFFSPFNALNRFDNCVRSRRNSLA